MQIAVETEKDEIYLRLSLKRRKSEAMLTGVERGILFALTLIFVEQIALKL